MQNPGEEVVGEYIRIIKGCDFIQYNLYTPDIQGELDVIGINPDKKIVYICEVATHLITGLQYVKNKRPDNVSRFINKFNKNIDYAEKYFPDYEHHFMLWSPIVKNQASNAKYNQMRDIDEIIKSIKKSRNITLKVKINEEYQECLKELREYAAKETKELKSPILRLMQIEERLKNHLHKNSR